MKQNSENYNYLEPFKKLDDMLYEFGADMSNETEEPIYNFDPFAYLTTLNSRCYKVKKQRAKKRFTKKEYLQKLNRSINNNIITDNLANNISANLIAKNTGLSYSYVNNIKNRSKYYPSSFGKRRGRKTILDKRDIDDLKRIVEDKNNPNYNADIILKTYVNTRKDNNRFKISKTTFYNYLTSKSKCNLSYKMVQNASIYQTNKDELILARSEFCKRALYYYSMNYTIIYIDESGFNGSLHPKRGYSLRGEICRIKYIGEKTKNVSLLCAVTGKGVLGYMLFKGSVKASDFTYFLCCLMTFLRPRKDYIILCDQARIHKDKTYSIIVDKYINRLYIPSYSCYLNMIEYFFGSLKKELRKNSYSNETDMINRLVYEIINYDNSKLANFENKALSYYERCLKMEKIFK
jgi:transposase